MADRYRDYDRDRLDRPGDASRERDERWRAGEHDRPLTDRASDEVRSWFGDAYRREAEAIGTAGRDKLGETPRKDENTGSVLGLAGTANTPEITPPDRDQTKKP